MDGFFSRTLIKLANLFFIINRKRELFKIEDWIDLQQFPSRFYRGYYEHRFYLFDVGGAYWRCVVIYIAIADLRSMAAVLQILGTPFISLYIGQQVE